MDSTETLVESVHEAICTSLLPARAFKPLQGYLESTEATTVSYASETGPAEVTSVSQNPWVPKYVLTLDGGGIRGYSTLFIIRKLMKSIAQTEQQNPIPATSSAAPLSLSSEQKEITIHDNTRIKNMSQIMPRTASLSTNNVEVGDSFFQFLPCHYFDYIGGTSTGGLIAIMLARLRMTISECIDEYGLLSAAVFGQRQFFTRILQHLIPRAIWSPAERNGNRLRHYMEGVVEKRLLKIAPGSEKQDSFESNPDLCRTIVVTFRENGVSQAPHLFRSYNNYRWAPPCAIWEVARATSATPLYFKPITINESKYLDGSIGANNPSKLVLHEVMQMHSESKTPIGLLLSIGTGTSSSSPSLPLTSLKSVISTQTKDTHKRILKDKNDINFYYQRFDADGLEDIEHNSWKPTRHSRMATLQRIKDYPERYLKGEKVQEELRECARKLVASRRRRVRTSDWNSFAFEAHQA